jgi:hypothetical protein
MIERIGEAVIARPPAAIVDFVTHLEQYKLADLKIGRVLEERREGGRVFMRHDGTLRGVPGPAVSLEMLIDPALRSVRSRSVASFPTRFVLTFDGGFELTPVDGGTHVVHRERFRFFAPFKWVAEPFLRAWLARDVMEEMVRLKALLEST